MFAKIKGTHVGTKLITDGGFTCLPEGVQRTVKRDRAGLYICCDEGHHYLDGQHNTRTGRLVGLTRKV